MIVFPSAFVESGPGCLSGDDPAVRSGSRLRAGPCFVNKLIV